MAFTSASLKEEVTPRQLKKQVGRRVEVVAFGMSYRGRLSKVDDFSGTICIRDAGNSAVIEIERIVSFKILKDHV